MRKLGFAVVALMCSLRPAYAQPPVQSRNFVVYAPSREIANEFAVLAEKYRKEKAIEWLGEEMPAWPEPCPLVVKVNNAAPRGVTRHVFHATWVEHDMEIAGPIERLRHSVLPHEITHTVFAYHFRQPVPRWADEGGSVYSEDHIERRRHDSLCRTQLNAGRGFELRSLFTMKEYPADVLVLYAEGYAVAKFLIELKDRRTFLNFVGVGMQRGWDAACRLYGFRSVEDLQEQWLDHLRGKAIVRTEPNREPRSLPNADLTSRTEIRSNAPPVPPQLEGSVVARGAAPEGNEKRGWNDRPRRGVELGPIQPLTATNNSVVVSPMSPASAPVSRPAPPPVVLFPAEPIPR